jgi:hypothetical protein
MKGTFRRKSKGERHDKNGILIDRSIDRIIVAAIGGSVRGRITRTKTDKKESSHFFSQHVFPLPPMTGARQTVNSI